MGRFLFGNGYAIYSGTASDLAVHQHAAIQIVLNPDSNATILDINGDEHSGTAILVRPLVWHALKASQPVIVIYLEAQSQFSATLMEYASPEGIFALPKAADGLFPDRSLPAIVAALKQKAGRMSDLLDPRLKAAIDALASTQKPTSMSDLAKQSGISESRLRTLAREQLGMPLSTWLIWQKLGRATRALRTGSGLADAATAGGFSDQAHFTRVMRRMFGTTPALAAQSLRG